MKRNRRASTFQIFQNPDDRFAWRLVEMKAGTAVTVAESTKDYGSAKKARHAISRMRDAPVDLCTDPELIQLPASQLIINRSTVPLRMVDHRRRGRGNMTESSSSATKLAAQGAKLQAEQAAAVMRLGAIAAAQQRAQAAAELEADKPAAANPLGANAAAQRTAEATTKPPLGAKAAARKRAKGTAKPRLGEKAAARRRTKAAAKKAAAKPAGADPAAAKPSAS